MLYVAALLAPSALKMILPLILILGIGGFILWKKFGIGGKLKKASAEGFKAIKGLTGYDEAFESLKAGKIGDAYLNVISLGHADKVKEFGKKAATGVKAWGAKQKTRSKARAAKRKNKIRNSKFGKSRLGRRLFGKKKNNTATNKKAIVAQTSSRPRRSTRGPKIRLPF